MKKSTEKKRHLFSKILIVLFSCYLVFTLIQLQIEIREKSNELALIQEACEEQELANKDLERMIQLGDDQEYLQRIAREKLDFAFPDEKIYVDTAGS